MFLFPLQHLEVVSPFQLYFNPTLILRQYQLWRLATTFLFFGTIGFSFLFNMIFTYRYCRMLEEGSFRGRSSDFVMMFVFGGALMIVRTLALSCWIQNLMLCCCRSVCSFRIRLHSNDRNPVFLLNYRHFSVTFSYLINVAVTESNGQWMWKS